MEPISELATRVTAHLWLLHDLYPDEPDITDILARNWQAILRQNAANDWSLLQLLCDLVRDPLPATKAADHKPEATRTPDERADTAVETFRRRMQTVQEQGLAAGISFAASGTPGPLQHAGKLAPARLLTLEELFQNVANWLLRRPASGELHAFADAFLGNGQFLIEEEITRCALAIQQVAKSSPKGKETSGQIDKDWLARGKSEKREMVLDRLKLRDLCRRFAVPVPFSIVLSDELDEISRSRLVRLYKQKADPSNPPSASEAREKCGVPVVLAVSAQQAFNSSLFGLALSGGGIRSATFALGLLQGMADRNLLPYIDVLSTVSGGGYIGSWLCSWIKRSGGVDKVQQSLRGSASPLTLEPDCPEGRSANAGATVFEPLEWVTRNSDPHSDHVRPVRLLRDYSRYLAPQGGFFSADSWTIAATWFRNTVLNLVVLVLFFGAALLLPRLAIFLLAHLGNLAYNSATFTDPRPAFWKLPLMTLLASAPLLTACLLIRLRNLNSFSRVAKRTETERRSSPGYNDTKVVFGILPLIWLGAFLELVVLWVSVRSQFAARPVVACFAVTLAAGVGILGLGTSSPDDGRTSKLSVTARTWRFLTRPLAFVVTVIVGSLMVYLLYSERAALIMNTERGLWIAGSAGLGLVVTWISAIVLILVGLFGRDATDELREWWSRLGAWLSLSIGAWLAACVICFFTPLWTAMLGLKVAGAGLGWLSITAAGVKFAFSPHSGHDTASSTQSRLKTIVMNIAPAVFVIGIVSAEAFALFWALEWLIDRVPALVDDPVAHQLCCTEVSVSFQSMLDNYWQLMYPGSLAPLLLMALFTLFCLYLASRVDINEFSMHNFYKNRLVRAYLGASRARAHRLPNAFTGFDMDDDIRLRRFQYSDRSQPADQVSDCRASYAGPFPIINTALNITRGEELGIQDRKAESFVFTPLWSGFDFTRRQTSVRQTAISEFAFQRTDQFGDSEQGAFLGTAMAISGAAFNANAGFHTQPALAFLLTIFGVRLGWWAGNPRTTKWTSPSPEVGLLYLLKELTANTSTNEDFVLLSDGGHFENMGLYELVRRRCRYIILSDAEEDEQFKLEGIGGAIRKCRDDFGVVIDLNLDALQPIGEPGVSRLHYSLGSIIYPGEYQCGKLIYIKSSVTADESLDIIEFRKRHSEFPHTSTANQFFDESHFESYRALGHHVASQIFRHDMPPLPIADCGDLTKRMEKLFIDIESAMAEQLSAPMRDPKEALASVINPEADKGESK